ncbi:MAG: hypothetical protein SCABRO_03883 [Candidatus Scalindua brodae]|uniref:Uncharacterized protein n=1 Tax=Candidatus Scalindua brodae TaxID=237368 RepID=A0A0B0EE89_9BACT|nr:MAG: hypothetical protein SCABRO_03883 [Candidatus Scalindua brodae]
MPIGSLCLSSLCSCRSVGSSCSAEVMGLSFVLLYSQPIRHDEILN